MFLACRDGDLPRVRALTARDPGLVRCHWQYRTPLYFAVRENRAAVAAFLLDHGADPLGLAVNDTLLQICQDRGSADLERLLRERYARLQGATDAGEPVAAAIRAHDQAEVSRLLAAQPGLLHTGDSRSNQPIHWATMTRQPDLVDLLLRKKVISLDELPGPVRAKLDQRTTLREAFRASPLLKFDDDLV